MTWDEIFDYTLKHYLSEDCLMRGHKTDSRPAFPPFKGETVGGDNGVMWLAEWLILMPPEYTMRLQNRLETLIEQLRHPDYKPEMPLYCVTPGRTDRKNSHDNLIAILNIMTKVAHDKLTPNAGLFNFLIAGVETNFRFDGTIHFPPQDVAAAEMLGDWEPGYFDRAILGADFSYSAWFKKPGGGTLKNLIRADNVRFAKKNGYGGSTSKLDDFVFKSAAFWAKYAKVADAAKAYFVNPDMPPGDPLHPIILTAEKWEKESRDKFVMGLQT